MCVEEVVGMGAVVDVVVVDVDALVDEMPHAEKLNL